MVNEEIFAGLKEALFRGETLQQAMMAFYNAGYKKEEIEEAARALQIRQFQQIQPQQPAQQPVKPRQIEPKKQPKKLFKKPVKTPKIREPPRTIVKQKPKKTIQKVSSYQKPATKPGGIVMTLVLIFALLILLGILAAVFFFKEDLIDLFNTLFS